MGHGDVRLEWEPQQPGKGVGIARVQDVCLGLLGRCLVWERTLCVHGVCMYALTEICCTFLSMPYV